jgi:hypothetical protein
MGDESHPPRFRRRGVAWSLSACSAVFLLIGASGLTVENQGIGPMVFFGVLTALSLFLVVRTFRMATLIADANSILIRGFLRSKRVPITSIGSVETLDQPNMYGLGGKTIVLRTVDGRAITAGEFWATTSRSGINRIDTLARELNEWCRSHRSEPTAKPA